MGHATQSHISSRHSKGKANPPRSGPPPPLRKIRQCLSAPRVTAASLAEKNFTSYYNTFLCSARPEKVEHCFCVALVAACACFGGRPRGFRATRGKQSRTGRPPVFAPAAVGPLLRAAALRGSLSAPIYRCFRSRVRALAACIPLA